MDVDAVPACLVQDAGNVRAATQHLLPPAAPAGPDDDLGDLMLVGEPGDRASKVVIVQFVPAGTHVRCQLRYPVQLRPARGPLRVTAGYMTDVEFPFDPWPRSGPRAAPARHCPARR